MQMYENMLRANLCKCGLCKFTQKWHPVKVAPMHKKNPASLVGAPEQWTKTASAVTVGAVTSHDVLLWSALILVTQNSPFLRQLIETSAGTHCAYIRGNMATSEAEWWIGSVASISMDKGEGHAPQYLSWVEHPYQCPPMFEDFNLETACFSICS